MRWRDQVPNTRTLAGTQTHKRTLGDIHFMLLTAGILRPNTVYSFVKGIRRGWLLLWGPSGRPNNGPMDCFGSSERCRRSAGGFDSGADLPRRLGYPPVWQYCSGVWSAREIRIALAVFITPSEKIAPGERGPACGSPKDRLVLGRDGPLVRVPLHVV